jgi:citrate synthase
MTVASLPFSPGLEGIVAAQTAISSVDGQQGELRGFSVEDLAPHATFEETVFLLWNDVLPDTATLERFRADLAGARALDRHTLELLKAAAARSVHPMDALRMACASLTASDADASDPSRRIVAARQDALRLVAAFPVIVAAYHRLSQGLEPVPPRRDLSHTANFLYMLHGREASDAFVRALDTYWNTVADHGLNASTFTARVIASTESDVISAVTGAVGALKGPLHGGAPGPALDLVFEVGRADRAEAVQRARHIGRPRQAARLRHRQAARG